MRISLRVCSRAVVTCLLLVVSASGQAQQHLFDTELTHDAEPAIGTVEVFDDANGTATLGNLHGVLSTHSTLFDRSRRRFEIGLNWGALDSKNLRTQFGVTVDDDRISPTRSRAVSRLSVCTDETRMIIVDDAFLWDEGFGMLTRIDPELGVDASTGRPVLPGGTSAALHAFADQGSGTAQGEHVQLRRTQGASEYSRNTNNRVWWPTYAGDQKIKRSQIEYRDPTRTGDFMIVGVNLRRIGAVPQELDDDAIVLKLRVLRQPRLWKNPISLAIEPDPAHMQWLRFSIIPTTPTTTDPNTIHPWLSGLDAPKQVGVDDLARLFHAFDDRLGNYNTDKSPPLRGAVSTQAGLTGRELVWQHHEDIRGAVGVVSDTPDEREEIRITAGMLRELVDHPSTPGGSGQLDGDSYWTVIEGLLVFAPGKPDDPSSGLYNDPKLHVYENENSSSGLACLEPNPPFVINGLRGRSAAEIQAMGNLASHQGSVTDLFVELEYTGVADIDVDYVVLQTPNARALLRDQYRAKLSRTLAEQILRFEGAINPDPQAPASEKKIFGFRSHEEKGEAYWYSQRYLNILTNGAFIGEINYRPFDRYRQCAYPLSNPQNLDYPDGPLPLWLWNETSVGRADPSTPVPFLSRGAGVTQKPNHYGLREGVCGFSNSSRYAYQMYDWPEHDDVYPQITGTERTSLFRLATDAYDFGKPARPVLPDLHTSSVMPPQGGSSGEFHFHRMVPLDFWDRPRWYEDLRHARRDHLGPDSTYVDPGDPGYYYGWYQVDTDGDTTNHYPMIEQVWYADLALQPDSKHALYREVNQQLAVGLYQEFLSPGNEQFLFSGVPWYEQAWLSSHVKVLRSKQAQTTGTYHNLFVTGSDHARQMTGEEVRIRFMMPLLLGASGVMAFLGGGAKSVVSPVSTATADARTTTSLRWVFNLRSAQEEATGTSLDTMHLHAQGDEYGADYPIPRAAVTLDDTAQVTVDSAVTNPLYTAGHELPYMAYHEDAQSQEVYEPILLHTFGVYTQEDSVVSERPGFEIVQRVDPAGVVIDSTPPEQRFYWGARSARLEWLRFQNWLKTPLSATEFSVTGDSVDIPATVAELVGLLDLQSWHARGFKEFHAWRDMPTATNPLLDWIDPDRLKVRHPYRTVNGRADYEHRDSNFVDVTLLHRRKTMSAVPYGPNSYVHGEVYIGVQNRRQNPLYMETISEPNSVFDVQPRFSSTQEFLALVSNQANGKRLYDQIGSRSVVLPFDHELSPTERVLLHVQEVAVADDPSTRSMVLYEHNDGTTTRKVSRRLLDTIIDGYGSLEVNLLPGEGKLLRVRRIPAVSTDEITGNLAFNGQTKIVSTHAQVVDMTLLPPVFTPYETEVVYHMVYTRRVDGLLRVFYRPSYAYPRDAVPDVAGMQWRAEIELGTGFTVRKSLPGVAGTQWQSGAHAFDDCYAGAVPPNPGYTDYLIDHDDSPEQDVMVQSAFPSISVGREVQVDAQGNETVVQRVHVVYSALVYKDYYGTEFGAPQRVGEQHIVETTLLPGQTGPLMAMDSRSLAVIGTQGDAAFNDSYLVQWGTPTNGVSSEGMPAGPPPMPRVEHDRVFTAWSVRPGQGITCGVRPTWGLAAPPDGGYFMGPVNGLNANLDQVIMSQSGVVNDQTAQAQYPSLTPTNTAVGGVTAAASLVWQEQARIGSLGQNHFDGWAIMYTRVWEDAGLAPAYGIHDYGFPDALNVIRYSNSTPPPLVPFPAGPPAPDGIHHNSVLRVSDDDAGRISLYPSIVRSGLTVNGAAAPAMSIVSTQPVSATPFQFETVTFQTRANGLPMFKIHRRHFIHQDQSQLPGPGTGLLYWYLGSTSSAEAHVVAPTVSNGDYRFAEQDYDYSYLNDDTPPLVITENIDIQGNISDTSVFSSFGLTDANLVHAGVGVPPDGTLNWETWGALHNVHQIPLRYAPLPPHQQAYEPHSVDQIISSGVWPHLSHQMFGPEHARQMVRRIQHTSNASDVSQIRVSAEGFYKGHDRFAWRRKGGFHSGDQEIVVDGLFDNEDRLDFRRDRRPATPLEQLLTSAFEPVDDLVTQPFRVEDLRELSLNIDGLLRLGCTLSVEEITPEGLPMQGRSVDLGLPEAPARDARSRRKTSRFTFTGGSGASRYRLRLHPGDNVVLHMADVLEERQPALPKQGEAAVDRKVVDLQAMEVVDLATQRLIRAMPNPASDQINVLVSLLPGDTRQGSLELYTTAGEVAWRSDRPVSPVITMDVSQLVSGVYHLRWTTPSGENLGCTLVVAR